MEAKKAEGLVPVMFRLSPEHIAALDALARVLSTEENTPKSRTDAVRWLINKYAHRATRAGA